MIARSEASETTAVEEQAWPAEVSLIFSALEAGAWAEDQNTSQYTSAQSHHERRRRDRPEFKVRATLKLFVDGPGKDLRVLYTRDANQRGLGFLTQHRLPLGYGGVLSVPNPKNTEKTLEIACTLIRCREAAPGWYEGSLYFNRDRGEFAPLVQHEDSYDEHEE